MQIKVTCTFWLFWITLVGVFAYDLRCGHAQDPTRDTSWTAEEVRVAVHCISEASGRPDDCQAIAWIDVHNAAAHDETVRAYMDRVHSRHLSSPSRPWMAELAATLVRPASWPAHAVPWETRGVEIWLSVLRIARAAINGAGHGCSAAPLTWGSPGLDRSRLDRWYNRGYRRVTCGASLNEFVGSRAR